MENFYIKKPESELEPQWFLLEGGIYDSYEYLSYDSFKDSLWRLFECLTSRSIKTEVDIEQSKMTLRKLIQMVKGVHYFLYHKNKLGYKEEWIDINWLVNPYRCIKKYRDKDDFLLNHHLAHFEENFTELSREEAQNFELSFENFFKIMDLSSWLNLFDDFIACLEEGESLFDWMGDSTPLKTYKELLKLSEACLVSIHWANLSYPSPNLHLYKNVTKINDVAYCETNPIDMISTIFCNCTYAELNENILKIYDSNNSSSSLTVKLDEFRFCLRYILQTGWLLLQTDYWPETWLKPNGHSFLACPIFEEEIDVWESKILSHKEKKSLTKTLSKLYFKINIHDEIDYVERRLFSYLNMGDKRILEGDEQITKNLLLKVLDIQAMIMLNYSKIRDDGVRIRFPKSSSIDENNLRSQTSSIEEVGNNNNL